MLLIFKVKAFSGLVGVAIGILTILGMGRMAAAESCTEWVAKVVSIEGTIQAQMAQQSDWRTVHVGERFCPGDTVKVLNWRAAIILRNETIIRLDQGTTVTFTQIEEKASSWIDVLQGIVHFISRVPKQLNVTTPFVNAAVEGTEFVIQVQDAKTNIWLLEGQLLVKNDLGSLTLVEGQAAVANRGEAPRRRLDVRPRDAVQWALYYPQLIDYRTIGSTEVNARGMNEILRLYKAGDLVRALAELEQISDHDRDSQFYATRAGLLLSVGQVERARGDIREAKRLDTSNGIPLALEAVIVLVQNDKETAYRLGQQAREMSPESPVPYIALSYVYQAQFNLEQALESAQEATKLAPEDGLAWARVSELLLSVGKLDSARVAADRAVALDPKLERTHTVLGFAHLLEIDIPEAKNAFEQAIRLDPSAALPHLGLGLAKIRNNELAEGRREIEVAASLDPNNSLIRSYLGKAYFEEKRDDLTSSQFAMAKELDPKDPTPYFYDAIHKQLTNRPVEALHDIQTSIALNNNRAPYRSRLMLDDDVAARGATIGRIYSTLGFQQRALVEGWYSLSTNPASSSGHRLLADSYTRLPRHEIARVSELLQSQLLQPLNTNNLQPHLAESSIQILETAGPAGLSFSEFNPLFVRNRARLLATGIVGNNSLGRIDGVLSGVQGPVSYSLGGHEFDSGGFRPNNDLEDTIFNGFGQVAITPKINLQVELRKRAREQGDLTLNFDPANFSPTLRRSLDHETARVGARFSPAVHSDFLVSYFHTNLNLAVTTPILSLQQEFEADQVEGQYLYRHDWFTATIGGGYNQIDFDNQPSLFGTPLPLQIIESTNGNGYLYINASWPTHVIWTGGVSVESLNTPGLDQDRVLPKAGVQWNVTDWIRLRFAYIQTLKRELIVNQTIEPTQVAGFNQFFDDANGSFAQRWGVAVDTVVTQNLYVGVEYALRKVKFPVINILQTTTFDRWEDLARGYVYWTPHPEWAVSGEAQFEQFRRSANEPSVTGGGAPSRVKTIMLPAGIRYFHPCGVFATFRGSYIRQELNQSPLSTLSRNTDEFFLVDAAIGYRLPKRLGIISIEAKNLFDQKFFYQDLNIQTAQLPVTPRFLPTRTVFGQVTVSF